MGKPRRDRGRWRTGTARAGLRGGPARAPRRDDLYRLTSLGRLDGAVPAERYRNVVNGRRVSGIRSPENEISRLHFTQRYMAAGVILFGGGTRQMHTCSEPRRQCQTRAVIAIGAGPAVNIRFSDLGERECDGHVALSIDFLQAGSLYRRSLRRNHRGFGEHHSRVRSDRHCGTRKVASLCGSRRPETEGRTL